MGLVTEKEREFTAEGGKGYENGYTKIKENGLRYRKGKKRS